MPASTLSDENMTMHFNAMMPPTVFANVANKINALVGLTETSDINTTAMESLINEYAADYSHTLQLQDSSLGGNSVINAMWSFARSDDVVHPAYRTEYKHVGGGMGRIYNEMYNVHQQEVHLIVGIPHYTRTFTSLLTASSSKLSNLARTGDTTIGGMLGRLFGTVLRIGFDIAFLPFIAVNALLNAGKMFPVSKYVEFEPSMHLYYRLVNSILHQLVVDMHMDAYINKIQSADSKTGNKPRLFNDKVDILAILDRRFQINRMYKNQQRVASNDAYGEQLKKKSTWYKKLYDDVFNGNTEKSISSFGVDSLFGGMQYISFRINKGSVGSESFSNQISQSAFASKMNSESAEGQERQYTKHGGIGIPGIDGIFRESRAFLEATTAIFKGKNVEQKFRGAFYDLPEMWKGATASRSFSLTMTLQSPLGDKLSILQSIGIPYAMWLALTLPRPVGYSMYTAPFALKLHAKGKFSSSLAMVESMSVQRGEGDFGWTKDGLPTSLTLTINLKDLSPILYLAMEESSLMKIFASNTGIREYISTLTGMGFRERLSSMAMAKNQARAYRLYWQTKYSSRNILNWLTDSRLGTMVANVMPADFYPGS